MTVSSTATRIAYTGNGVTTAFAFSWRFLATSEIKVYVGGVLQSTGYSVSAPGSSGTVTFNSAPANGAKIVIRRETALTQNIDYVANDAFAADTTEGGFDRAMLAAQDNAAAIGRSLRVADNAAPVSALSLTGASLKYVIVNSDEDGFEYADSAPQEINVTTETAFWADIDGVDPRIWRMRDRVFVGNATLNTDNRNGDNGTWLPNGAAGASWAPRDSQFCVMQDIGCIAISGLTRSGDSDAVPISAAAIGVGGYVVANSSIGRSGWGLYSDVQFESGNYGYGLEIAVKNKGADQTSTPYFATTGTYGIWLPGGGDNSYGGSAANPNNTAIAIGKNASTWNKGIVFFKDGLTGTDGTTGTATAIEMAKGHRLVWRTPGNNTAFSIRSDAASAASDTAIVGQDNAISIFGANAGHIAKFTHVTSGANYLNVNNAAAAAAPSIEAIGSDTDIDVKLSPKGVGCVRSGTYALPVTLGTSAVQVATGAVTTEEVLATITIPAGIMGLNGRLRFSADGALTSSGNTKTIRVRFGGIGGTIIGTIVYTTTAGWRVEGYCQNRNSASSQRGFCWGRRAVDQVNTDWGDGVAVTFNTANATTLVITGQKATAGETLTLESYCVELLP